ncbi:uncharacterized protein PV07_02356 [Cladophialophora immunda]|uniref:Zn(2)-C6 fungal-type domain-containing protein n=1 Tax=Cladophialophora immunda TaxID=569365 RepID=A0A0D2A5M3_9EURO|nr:uncharacterized protein PV07_02356 [Cladophialophora immunda]KIW35671.1 hypothetical protein PV07_02356 [Cladophialophora immunda]
MPGTSPPANGTLDETLGTRDRVRVRKRYTSHACMECQRRKRKCTGERVCMTCRYIGTECVYSTLRSAKSRTPAQSTAPSRPSEALPMLDARYPQKHSSIQESSLENVDGGLEARTRTLEQRCEALAKELATLHRPEESDRRNTQTLPVVVESPTSLSVVSSAPTTSNTFERNTAFMSDTAYSRQIDQLDQSVTQELGEIVPSGGTSLAGRQVGPGAALDSDYIGNSRDMIEQIIQQTRLGDADNILHWLELYFQSINPFYPCINEFHMRVQLASFLANDTSCMSQEAVIHFAALLNFMIAVVRILHDVSAEGSPLPGWQEFDRGEQLLRGHRSWLERPTMTTIQVFLIKAIYCQHISKLNAAYDATGTAIRLCFQLGLHSEPSWGDKCSYFERTYRQRIFWSTYCMNHNIAQNSGLPHLLHKSDFKVEYPMCVDDRMLYPNCPRLAPSPKVSPVPYMIEVIQWSKLASAVWDVMFGVRAEKPVSQAFISSTDSKIMNMAQRTPEPLRWAGGAREQGRDTVASFIRQQSFVLYLRARALRLLLRHEEMMSLRCGSGNVQLCIGIAAEVVAAVETAYSAGIFLPNQRQSYALHLTSVIVHMICVVLQHNSEEGSVRPAVDLLNRSHRIVEEVSVGFAFARGMLIQLRRPIRAARHVLEQKWPRLAFWPPSQPSQNAIEPPVPIGLVSANEAISTTWGNEPTATGAASIELDESFMFDPEGVLGLSSIWEDVNYWTTMNTL